MEKDRDHIDTPASDDTTPDPPPAPRTPAEISRENGAKSRGPVTPQGKAASSKNSLKHGLLARTIVLPGESKKRFARHLNNLRKLLEPANDIERHLVECMAVARWRQLRAWGFESAVISHEVRRQTLDSPELLNELDSTQTALSVRQSDSHARFLDRINQWNAGYERQYDRALRRLLAWRAATGRAPVAIEDLL